MSETNKYGLSRNIPSPIQREVRQRCGFGCVFCGLFLYQYEHIAPPFSEATAHDADNICLLCPNHHERVKKGSITKKQVKEAYANPIAIQKGFSHESEFTHLRRPCIVHLGSISFDDPGDMIQTGEKTILGMAEDEDGNVTFNGLFFGRDGHPILEIVKNEWKAFCSNWDVEFIGKRLTLRNASRLTSMSVVVWSAHEILFDDLNMNAPDFRLVTKSNGALSLLTHSGGGFKELKELNTRGPIVVTASGFQIKGGCALR